MYKARDISNLREDYKYLMRTVKLIFHSYRTTAAPIFPEKDLGYFIAQLGIGAPKLWSPHFQSPFKIKGRAFQRDLLPFGASFISSRRCFSILSLHAVTNYIETSVPQDVWNMINRIIIYLKKITFRTIKTSIFFCRQFYLCILNGFKLTQQNFGTDLKINVLWA